MPGTVMSPRIIRLMFQSEMEKPAAASAMASRAWRFILPPVKLMEMPANTQIATASHWSHVRYPEASPMGWPYIMTRMDREDELRRHQRADAGSFSALRSAMTRNIWPQVYPSTLKPRGHATRCHGIPAAGHMRRAPTTAKSPIQKCPRTTSCLPVPATPP